MSQNLNRPKSLAGNKYKPPVPQYNANLKNVKKRDSFRNQQDSNYEFELIENNQRNSIRLKSHKGIMSQNTNSQQNNYYNGSLQTNGDGLLYFSGNVGGQHSSKSNKRAFASNCLNIENSKEYSDLNTDEFNDNNLVKKNLQLYIDEINNETTCQSISKQTKSGLNQKSSSNQSTSQSSSTTPISTNGFQQPDHKKSKANFSQQANQSKSSKKGEKYISIKDTIAAYKEVEQKMLKNNDNIGRPPLLISTNNQLGGSSITPQSVASNQVQNQFQQQNLINSIKQVYSEERLNVIGSQCQQQITEKKGIPFGLNLNQRPGQSGLISNKSNNSSITTNNQINNLLNKENSTNAPSFQSINNQATNAIYNYLVNPSAALPPSKTNSINVFRIKKQQSSTRNSFNQQTPQQNNYYQIEGNNNFYVQQIFNSQKSKQQNYLNQEIDQEEQQVNDKNNTSFNIPDSVNSKGTNQSQVKQKYQLGIQPQLISTDFSNQESSQLERNSSKTIGSNRYIQSSRQISSAQRPPKTQKQPITDQKQNSTNNMTSMQFNQSNNKVRISHTKRNSEKFTGNTINTNPNWSPEASICQQADVSSDEIQSSPKSNRSQSSQNRKNKSISAYEQDGKVNEIKEISPSQKTAQTNINLQKSNLTNKISKQNEHSYYILQTINTTEIKPLYWNSQAIDDIANTDQERNILILKAENLLFGSFTSESFWEKKENLGLINNNGIFGGMINFNGNSSNNIRSAYLNNGQVGQQGDIYGNKLNEIKKILRTLQKHYLIFLLFNSCSKKVRDLVSFMIKQNFSFDGAYYTYTPQVSCIYSNKSVNLQQIIIDYKLHHKINKIVIFDAVPSNFQVNLNQNQFQRNNFRTPAYSTQKKRNLSYQPLRSKSGFINAESEPYLTQDKILFDQSVEKDDSKQIQNQNCFKLKKEQHFKILQDFIPKFEEKIIGKTKVVLFKQRVNPNLLQANQKKVLEVGLSFVDPRINSFSNNLYFLNLDIRDIISQAYEEGQLNHRKRNFLKEINKVKQQNKNTKEVIELDSDKAAENFRNRLIEYMKSTNKQIHNLYYLVGDLVVRNRNIFQKYYADPFHCKKKNVDNLLQLDMLRYKSFPKLNKQMYFRGKQAQDYQNLMKQLPQKNPYDILFFPEENTNPYLQKQIENNEATLNQKDQKVDTIDFEVKQPKNESEQNQNSVKKKCSNISFNLPISFFLCTEVSI